jgi:L-cysteine:1D-myo-inositol 2-amino-2-deoxy-alpha-D-glucopyranoside ligase
VVPWLEGQGSAPRIHDSSTNSLLSAEPSGAATLYVCGITPYDATHIGHAATYVAYDTLIRVWLDAGYEVNYVQNVTDVDDPLLERATAIGVDWRDLAVSQIDLFRDDMERLSVIPPQHYVGVTEKVAPIAVAVAALLENGFGYYVDDDVYFDNAAAAAATSWYLGLESGLSLSEMLPLFAERGGDPLRPGKRNALDPLLWRAARDGEPSWPTVLGEGRPGWHIECSVIAQEYLDLPLTVNGGGIDLAFPHHEFTAGHTAALTDRTHSDIYSHTALVSYQGAKMSKSLGNLVLVSHLVKSGVDARAIRLAILAHHYRAPWEWTDQVLSAAQQRLSAWTLWASGAQGSGGLTAALRSALAADLDTPAALATVDAAVASGAAPSASDIQAVNALLGIALSG